MPPHFHSPRTARYPGTGDYAFRYYDPESGRWLNRDPIQESGGTHLYRFNYNNPLSWFDYLGKNPTQVDGAHSDQMGSNAPSVGATPPGRPPGPSAYYQFAGYPPGTDFAERIEERFPAKVDEMKAAATDSANAAVREKCPNILEMPDTMTDLFEHEYVPAGAKGNSPPTEHPDDPPMGFWETHVSFGRHVYRLNTIEISGPSIELGGQICWDWKGDLDVADHPGVTTGDFIGPLSYLGVPKDSPPVSIASWPLSATVCCCPQSSQE